MSAAVSASAPVDPIPENCRHVVPCLAVRGAAGALDFYVRAFGAVEHRRAYAPDGRVVHADFFGDD